MRTTVTLDPDVAEKLRELAHRKRSPFKTVLNETIRRGLAAQEGANAPSPTFVVVPHRGGFRPGIDLAKLNQLADQLEASDFQGEARSQG